MFSSANDRFSDSRPVIMCVYFCSQRMHHRRDGKGQKLRGKQVYLRHALTPETYDSTIVKNGTFRFTLGETSPEVSLLVLKASSDDLFPVTLPVVTEKGVVKVVLGELVLTSGTDLNDRLQDFLLAVDRFGDEMAGKGESHSCHDSVQLPVIPLEYVRDLLFHPDSHKRVRKPARQSSHR